MRRSARKRRVWLERLELAASGIGLAWKTFRRAPPKAQLFIGGALLFLSWLGANWVIQVARKPTELFFPVSDKLYKAPKDTWAEYRFLFQKHSTSVVTPDLLAALAQAEGAGNPVARTYWRWSFTSSPFQIYKPASSAVGMYQITDGTYEAARRLCIHSHAVTDEGPWYDWRTCWFNWLYSRVIPTHAVEMTSAHLDREVTRLLSGTKFANAPIQQKQNLAILIHLCGAGVGEAYVRRGMKLPPKQRCGEHDAKAYLAHVNELRSAFARLMKD